MNETFDDTKDYTRFVPSNKIIKQRETTWKSLIEKYSNCNDNEEDGLTTDQLNNIEWEEEEDEISITEAIETSDEESDNNQELVQNKNFYKLSNSEKYESVVLKFSPEVIQAFVKAFQKRFKILETKNLQFWRFSKESMKLTESLSEQSVMTPNCSVNSRLMHRSKEFNRTNMTFNGSQQVPTMFFNNDSLNGLPQMNNNSSYSLNITNPHQMPEVLQKLIGAGRGFKMKVIERTYDISVCDPLETSGALLVAPIASSKQLAIMPQPSKDATQEIVQYSSSSDEITVVEQTIKEDQDSDSDVLFVSEEVASLEKRPQSVNEELPKKQRCNSNSQTSTENKSKDDSLSNSTKNSETASVTLTKALTKTEKQFEKSNEIKLGQKLLIKKDKQVKPRTNNTKRNAPSKSTTETKTKKVRIRASRTLSSSSSEEKETLAGLKPRLTTTSTQKSNILPEKSDKSANISNETTEELFIQSPALTLDDISCGPSCSDVSSDDDFLHPSYLEQKKKQKMLEHRQNKLMIRTSMNSKLVKSSSKKAKHQEQKENNFNDGSSPYESDDDFLMPQAVREKRKAKKARSLFKLKTSKTQESTVEIVDSNSN